MPSRGCGDNAARDAGCSCSYLYRSKGPSPIIDYKTRTRLDRPSSTDNRFVRASQLRAFGPQIVDLLHRSAQFGEPFFGVLTREFDRPRQGIRP